MSDSLDIIYQDDSLVVVNKPGGLLSVPGRRPEHQDCVSNRIKRLFPHCPPHPAVHRLDMATSGLLVLALTARSQRNLAIQFQERSIKKSYIALLDGIIAADNGRIALPFRLDPENRPHQIHDPVHGKMGVTDWQKLSIEDGKTRIRFTPLTGRTHQLRVHAAHRLGLDCPIIGDSLYGTGAFGDKMYLHAAYLRITHPDSGLTMEFNSASPF